MASRKKVKVVLEKTAKTNSESKAAPPQVNAGNESDQPAMTQGVTLNLEESVQVERQLSESDGANKQRRGANKSASKNQAGDAPEEQVIRERENEFRVYLDSNLRIRWEVSTQEELPAPSQSAITQAQLISATPAPYLSAAQKKAWMRILGESIALALTQDNKNANKAVEAARTFILSRANEKAKVWYVQGSLIFALFLSVAGLIPFFMASSQSFSVLLAMVCGVAGAQFSVLSRLATLEVDPSAGKTAHYTEAIVRILMGALAGIITFAGVKSGLVFGFIESSESNSFWLLALMSILAGASERFVPSFLNKMETTSLEFEDTQIDASREQKSTK